MYMVVICVKLKDEISEVIIFPIPERLLMHLTREQMVDLTGDGNFSQCNRIDDLIVSLIRTVWHKKSLICLQLGGCFWQRAEAAATGMTN